MKQETELIKQLICGSRVAFDDIYKIYSGRLFGYCLNYTKSRELSEDIVQDVFIKLWVSRATIKNVDSLGPYIFTIAKHHIINIYCQHINSPIYEEYVKYCNNQAVSINDTHHKVEYDDFVRQVDKAISKLPKTQQAVIECCKMEQLSGREAAEKLNLSEQTIKNQLSIAIKYLRNKLKYIPILIVIF